MTGQPVSGIDDIVLEAFQTTRMGWLTHEGKLLNCRLHQHIHRLRSEPFFDDAFRRHEKALAENAAYIERELESLDPGDPPEMHRFEGLDDEAKAELVDAIYRAGWVRIGMAYDREKAAFNRRGDGPFGPDPTNDPRNWYVEAEGHDTGLAARGRDLSALSTALGCTIRRRSLKPLAIEPAAGPEALPTGGPGGP